MRHIIISLILIFVPLAVSAKEVRDTVYSRQGDKIILKYNISADGDRVVIHIHKPRIVPTETLRKYCKGDLERLKIVVFDHVGNYGKVKWTGLTPTAFMVPSGMVYSRTEEGYHIFGESEPLVFNKKSAEQQAISFPVYIALNEKKQSYKIIGECTRALTVLVDESDSVTPQVGYDTARKNAHSGEEYATNDNEVTRALNSIKIIHRMLETETELPFSQALIMEVSNLRSIQDRIRDADMIGRISDVFLAFNEKERELKDAQKQALLSAQDQEQALINQQKIEEENRLKEAEEKARIQEDKQQKRTILLIIGGLILGIIGFVSNAVFKYFMNINNQKSIMQMQESIAKQAEHEATRRSREIVRNKTHQAVNKGTGKLRETIQDTGKIKKNTKRRSI